VPLRTELHIRTPLGRLSFRHSHAAPGTRASPVAELRGLVDGPELTTPARATQTQTPAPSRRAPRPVGPEVTLSVEPSFRRAHRVGIENRDSVLDESESAPLVVEAFSAVKTRLVGVGERCGEEAVGPVLAVAAGVGEDELDFGVADLEAGELVGKPVPSTCSSLNSAA
jgi:hypothetical protein